VRKALSIGKIPVRRTGGKTRRREKNYMGKRPKRKQEALMRWSASGGRGEEQRGLRNHKPAHKAAVHPSESFGQTV